MARILMTIIGILFILNGIVWGMLGVIGEKSTGLITDVRREMGERADSKSGTYTYSISYSFKLPDGETVHGSTKKISDGVYIKHPNTAVAVRYLKAFPKINILEKNAGFNGGNIAFIIIGAFLLLIVNKY
jgi:hypothetical protein